MNSTITQTNASAATEAQIKPRTIRAALAQRNEYRDIDGRVLNDGLEYFAELLDLPWSDAARWMRGNTDRVLGWNSEESILVLR